MQILHILFSLFQRQAQRVPVKVHLSARKADDVAFYLPDEGDCACAIDSHSSLQTEGPHGVESDIDEEE